jgi:hypothetical protein
MEIDLENKFRRWVKKQGGHTYKWYGSKEKLDLIVVTHTGVIGLLELKNPDGSGRLLPQQKNIIKEIGRKTPVCSNDFDECCAWYHATSMGLYLKIGDEI